MIVFVDSFVWFAAVFAKDARRAPAKRILSAEPALVTTDHIIVETWLLLKNRFNQAAAEAFCQRIMGGWCRIEIATFEDLRSAESIRNAFHDQRFSLVDRTSFVVMERLGIARVASFDDDFLVYRYGANRDRAFEVLKVSKPSDVTGVILAGGLSRRMGGGDKGLLELAGKPMLAHVIDRLTPQVGALVINANGEPRRFARFGLPVVPDTVGGFVGPLAGVLAGMRWSLAHAPAARFIATAAGDAPLLPRDLVDRLMAAVEQRAGAIALAQSYGELHPVIGLWPVALAQDLEDQLGSGVRKVLHWTDRHGTVPVPFSLARICGLDIDPFFNANTPPELDRLRAMVAKVAK